MLPDPIVFVGGSERSGTTLLRNMLTAHPKLAVPNESPFVFRVHRQLARRGEAADVALAWHEIQGTSRFKQWGLPAEDVQRRFDEQPPGSYAELVRLLFATYACRRGAEHAGDKTTGNALRFSWLSEQFPDSRFVHVVRDPREVCMSRVVQIFNRGGIVGAARHWRAHVAAAREAAPGLGNRLLEIRYEQLVGSPQEQLERLAGFLGIGFDPAMLQYSCAPDVLPRHDQDVHAREAVQRSLRPWRSELSRDDIAVIETIAGELMDEVGYPRELGRLTTRAAAVLAREWIDERHERWLAHGAPQLGALLRRQVVRRP